MVTTKNLSSQNKRPAVFLVGAGAMGGALLRGWLETGAIASTSIVIDPAPSPSIGSLCDQYAIEIVSHGDAIDKNCQPDVQVFAVKPQMAGGILPAFGRFAQGCVSISVMAGLRLARLESLLSGAEDGAGASSDDLKIVRAMPNLPSNVGAGMTGLAATKTVSDTDKDCTSHLLNAVGASVWVRDDDAIDAVTAISGSGPAYLFLMAEALQSAGEGLGLAPETAEQLARQTIFGAGKMLSLDPRDAASFRESVTSPGGTTAAALSRLDHPRDGLRPLVERAAIAARDRARDLAD